MLTGLRLCTPFSEMAAAMVMFLTHWPEPFSLYLLDTKYLMNHMLFHGQDTVMSNVNSTSIFYFITRSQLLYCIPLYYVLFAYTTVCFCLLIHVLPICPGNTAPSLFHSCIQMEQCTAASSFSG